MAYKKELVAFIDLLGFKEMNVNPSHKSSIHDMLITNEDFVNTIEYLQKEKSKKSTIKIFSDSIFLSYPPDKLGKLLDDLSILSLKVGEKGFFFRGGIFYDDVYSTNSTLYGPAVIKAYELESKVAIYPRIILAKELNTFIYDKVKKKAINNDILAKDFDGYMFVDFLHKISDANTLSKIRTHIENNFNETKDNYSTKYNLKIFQKYYWLANYFNTSLLELNNDYTTNIQPIDINLSCSKII